MSSLKVKFGRRSLAFPNLSSWYVGGLPPPPLRLYLSTAGLPYRTHRQAWRRGPTACNDIRARLAHHMVVIMMALWAFRVGALRV